MRTLKEHYKEILNERLFNRDNPIGNILGTAGDAIKSVANGLAFGLFGDSNKELQDHITKTRRDAASKTAKIRRGIKSEILPPPFASDGQPAQRARWVGDVAPELRGNRVSSRSRSLDSVPKKELEIRAARSREIHGES
jgi:hypothetical protein